MAAAPKKIGLVSWIGSGNYGTTLQAFALFRFLTEKGYYCYYILDISPSSLLVLLLKEKLKSILKVIGVKRKSFSDEVIQEETLKKRKLNQFINDELEVVSAYSYSDKRKVIRDTNVFCVGSDQVWNSYYSKDIFTLLPWVRKTKKISYASSIGTKDVSPEMRDVYRKELMKFSHISLREKTGCIAISNLTGRNDIKLVLDPTFLLDKDRWVEVSQNAVIEIPIPEKYILCYLIGNNDNYHAQLKHIQEQTGIEKVVQLPAEECWNFNISGAIRYEGAAIKEFVMLLNKATVVVTDSFHATALCINMQKDFIEFLRYKKEDSSSQNSRIFDVLRLFNLEDRIYSSESNGWARAIDFTEPQAILDKNRKKSIDYLINAIEN